MHRPIPSTRHYSRGFSLVEIMVGLLVGLLSMLVIMKTMLVFVNQQRTTTSVSDAQGNALISMVRLEQAIRSVGSGFNDPSAFACTTIYAWNDGSGALAMSLAPLQITDGGPGRPDAITVQAAGNFLGNIPATITSAMPSSSSDLDVSRTTGFSSGDLVLVSQGGNCTLMQLTAVQPAALKLQHNPGGSPSYNPNVPYQAANNWPAYGIGANILDLGTMTTSTFAIQGYRLQARTIQLGIPGAPATTIDLVTDIVNLQAQYGIAPAGSQNVNAWVDATGATWAAPSPTSLKMIKAIRLAVVIRSGKRETSNVTSACTNVSGTVNTGPCAWPDTAADPAPAINLSINPDGTLNPDWQKYRYRVYHTIIPLRNVIWGNL